MERQDGSSGASVSDGNGVRHTEYAKLGKTGMDVSRICLGGMGFGDAERWVHKWVLDEENSRPIVKKALEPASTSSTRRTCTPWEKRTHLGQALKDFANRDQVVIATKVHGQMSEGPNGRGLSRKHILGFDRQVTAAPANGLC